ncbi:MAG: energy transducer TonB [Acidobacteria bacterium]|nr:energy transducer TonB [Acidobacteriota bacterium]MBI3657083.1 energy transducer TonB [Acidobacteriota bacterium]
MIKILAFFAALAGSLSNTRGAVVAPPQLYVGPEIILTLEFINSSAVILNVINLSDHAVLFEPKNLIFKSRAGLRSIGQVIDMPETDNRGNTWKYRATFLILPRASQGFTVRGALQGITELESVLVKFGGRRYYLAMVAQTEFDHLAAKISDIDLAATDFTKLFDQLKIPTLGKQTFPTGPAAAEEDTRGLITAEGVNPPRVVTKLPVPLTESARKGGLRGPIKVSGLVTRDGDWLNAKAIGEVGYGMKERVLESVKNSWRFLPATKNGEVVDATVTIVVDLLIKE